MSKIISSTSNAEGPFKMERTEILGEILSHKFLKVDIFNIYFVQLFDIDFLPV